MTKVTCITNVESLIVILEVEMKFGFVILVGSLLMLSLVSCKKDKEMPMINVNSPAENATFSWGTDIHVDIDLSDDRGLKNYSIYMGDQTGISLMDFNFNYSKDTSSKELIFHEHFIVPTNAPDSAYMYIALTDMEYKATQLSFKLYFEQ